MTSAHDHEAEVTRLRRTFRVAVIAAAVGATIGAGVVVTVVGAVFSVIERPAAEAGKTEKTETRTEKSKAAVQAQKSTPQETQKARARTGERAATAEHAALRGAANSPPCRRAASPQGGKLPGSDLALSRRQMPDAGR